MFSLLTLLHNAEKKNRQNLKHMNIEIIFISNWVIER